MNYAKIILVSTLFLIYTHIVAYASPPRLSCEAAVLMDVESGRVLYEQNSRKKLPMASTTKILTAIVALEHGNLSDLVTVTPEASGIEGSSIWLKPGEIHTLEDLLYGLMLRSGNDAATAIALHISGSIEGFSKLMNKTAKRIGAKDSNFVNPHGLHDEKHYTTAYDLALIASYGLKNPDFEKIVSTKYHTIPWEGHKWDRAMKNKNKILWSYEGANGVKTGYTKKAGRCFVGSAKRNNIQLVAVVLNCGPMFEDSIALMDYGFENYKRTVLYKSNQVIKILPVKNGQKEKVSVLVKKDCAITLTDEEIKNVKTRYILPDELEAPIEKGQWIGSLQIYLNDQLLEEIPLITKESVKKRNIWDFFRNIINLWRD